MTVLTRGYSGLKVYSLGLYSPEDLLNRQAAWQQIDHCWDDDIHLACEDHSAKIIVYGDDCINIAARLTVALNGSA